ncbi:type II secretion system protein PulO, putative [Syntrophotalea carbinolica DSM 2380]|uniref:Type II secretion system protein PulO, putative n=1 Tax=Syntrophotalea carbinolica (strain DSM 2380 / NBRC 103641 / GraBd1) TaxID=338963 RepID=Q3A896_SYNC1|nr:type 4a pilus biogenesis protein PilO [Syntrophotalea carbinolica]ABA87396.1 type II secretion system protein PulO, putative [Syntrophotalea carbinolica DSM 2380]
MTARNKIIIGYILKCPSVLGVVLLVCLNFGLTLWGTLVLSPEIDLLEADICRQTKVLETRSLPESADGSKEAAYARNARDLRAFHSAIPDQTELPALIEELFSYAAKLNISIERVTYHPYVLEGHGLLQYDLNFQLEGSYDQIKHMIFLLENSHRIIAINKLGFHRRAAGSGNVVLGLDLETYFGREVP